MNLALQLARAGRQYGRVEAFVWGSISRDYAEVSSRVQRVATAMHDSGLRPGDRVAVMMQNRPELIESMYAAWHAGLVVVPINCRAHPREAAFIIDNAEASMAFVGAEYENELLASLGSATAPRLITVGGSGGDDRYEGLVAAAEPRLVVETVSSDDLAWLFYTSGTTGRPKGAMLSHRNLRSMALSHLADIRSFTPGESVLHAAPLTHGSGLVMLNEAATGRAARTLPLASVCYGGAPMFTSDLRVALDTFGPIFAQIYGQGESPMTITALDRDQHERFWREDNGPRLGTVGLPRTDVEVRLLDEGGSDVETGQPGEVAVRGDVVMSGYWRNPAASEAALRDGWLLTGDIGMFDDGGYLLLLDRTKDLIISGGNNIYPRELEEVILLLKQVAAVAVVGVPDRLWGESVHAVIVRHEGAELADEEVIQHVRGHLASYKKPRTIAFVESLPMNAYGKVLKRRLREEFQQPPERA